MWPQHRLYSPLLWSAWAVVAHRWGTGLAHSPTCLLPGPGRLLQPELSVSISLWSATDHRPRPEHLSLDSYTNRHSGNDRRLFLSVPPWKNLVRLLLLIYLGGNSRGSCVVWSGMWRSGWYLVVTKVAYSFSNLHMSASHGFIWKKKKEHRAGCLNKSYEELPFLSHIFEARGLRWVHVWVCVWIFLLSNPNWVLIFFVKP